MYKGRETEMTNMKDENPAAVEHSSTQIIKQPRMKKSIQRRQIKSHFSRWRPVNSASPQKRGKSRSQDSNSHKRMISYSQKKRLKAYYSSLRGCRAKFPSESGVSHIPPKTVNKQQMVATTDADIINIHKPLVA
uniref:Uncharacterized protein n=1 Tax=Sphaerodactylus townsendi TaxID=933632 RepID=A0ACB8F0N1_9SAUR